jgi:hypothetical protein
VKLADTQARFATLVTARDSVAEIAARDGDDRAAVDTMIVGDARLSAVERLDVYASMYFVRIHDVLRGDYARTLAVVGGEAFHGLVTDYLQACPPAHPSLREAGARLPDFSPSTRWRASGRGSRSWRAWSARASRCSTGRTRRRWRSRRSANSRRSGSPRSASRWCRRTGCWWAASPSPRPGARTIRPRRRRARRPKR